MKLPLIRAGHILSVRRKEASMLAFEILLSIGYILSILYERNRAHAVPQFLAADPHFPTAAVV